MKYTGRVHYTISGNTNIHDVLTCYIDGIEDSYFSAARRRFDGKIFWTVVGVVQRHGDYKGFQTLKDPDEILSALHTKDEDELFQLSLVYDFEMDLKLLAEIQREFIVRFVNNNLGGSVIEFNVA